MKLSKELSKSVIYKLNKLTEWVTLYQFNEIGYDINNVDKKPKIIEMNTILKKINNLKSNIQKELDIDITQLSFIENLYKKYNKLYL
jgi:2C-methyl-D-erythritol 2,4-cyclodiphosphate synthase